MLLDAESTNFVIAIGGRHDTHDPGADRRLPQNLRAPISKKNYFKFHNVVNCEASTRIRFEEKVLRLEKEQQQPVPVVTILGKSRCLHLYLSLRLYQTRWLCDLLL